MKVRFTGREYFLQSNYFSHHSVNFAKNRKEKALSAIKTSYLNSYKVIVAGARDFADYAYMKKKQKTSVNNLRHFFVSLQHKKSSKREK